MCIITIIQILEKFENFKDYTILHVAWISYIGYIYNHLFYSSRFVVPSIKSKENNFFFLSNEMPKERRVLYLELVEILVLFLKRILVEAEIDAVLRL